MRRYLTPALLLANLVLAGFLAWLWVTPQGQLRDVRWTPPAPIKPVLTDSIVVSWSADLGSFLAALDRPLFSSTRRPPPPKPEPAAVAAVIADTLADVRILGLYSTGAQGGGGAIVRAEGKVRRVKPGDSLGGWTVKEVRPGELVMARGSEARSLDVKRGPDVVADTPTASAGPGGPGQNPNNMAPQQLLQRQAQEANDSTARVNAMRARAGLPPLP